MTKAIGMKGRGQGIARIIQHKTLKSFINNDLALAIENPLIFHSGAPRPTQGYPAEVLVQLCEAILQARDKRELKTVQEHRYADACYILVRAFAKVGLIALIDEATGYQEIRDRLALQAILDRYLRKELAAWAKRFPDEFYQQMFRLKNWQWRGMAVNRPSIVGHYTNDIVYERIESGLLEELQRRNPRGDKGQRKAKHHQWLTENVGHPRLAEHLYAIIGFMRASSNWSQFYRMLQRAFPKKGATLALPFPEPEE